ncbi:MAG: hypothetical protein WBW33_10935, partial [Bryobacteraceae bacterium]
AMMKTDADRGQAPVSQGAHTSPYRVTEARRRVDTASLSPDQQDLFSEQPRASASGLRRLILVLSQPQPEPDKSGNN